MVYRGEPYNENYYVGDHPQGYSDITQTQKWASNRADNIQSFYGTFRKQDDILVVGCAFGYLVEELASRDAGPNVVGLDISAYAIQQAQILFPTLEFQNIDIFNNTFHNNQFNLIVLENVIDCMPDKATSDLLFEEIARILSNNGMVYALVEATNLYYLIITNPEYQAYIESGSLFGKTLDLQDVGHLPIRADKRVVIY